LTTGSFVLGYRASISSSNLSEESTFLGIFEGASRSITVSLVYESSAYQIKIVRQISLSAVQTYYFPHDSNSLDIVVKCSNRKFSFHKRTDKGLENIGDEYEVLFQNPATLEVGAKLNEFEGLSETLVFAPVQFVIHPCLTGLPCFETLSVAFSEYYRDDFAQFSVRPSAPGTFNSVIHGVGQYIGSSEPAGEIQVLDVMDRDTETSLVVSPVKALYTDAEDILDCPEHAADSDSNGGSLICHVSCICDGTDDDASPVEIVFDRGGDAYSQSPNELPGFKYESEGRSYGMNFAYDSLPYDPSLYFQGYRVHYVRTLNLKSGKKLYYGALVTSSSNTFNPNYPLFDVRVKLQKVVHPSVTRYWAELWVQQNSTLSSALLFLDTTDPDEVQTDLVIPGVEYGVYRLYSAGVRVLSVEIKRVGQADAEYKVIAQTHWAVQSSTMGRFEVEYSNEIFATEYANRLHLEIKEPVGRLFYVLQDPCTKTYTKGIASSGTMDLRTDSIAAAEIYDGRVALLYQTYTTRNYTVPGGTSLTKIAAPADISFRTINQSDNGFLETAPGRLSCDEFYGLHCFDAATDEAGNLVVVFNRERFLSASTHHNQSYSIQNGVITPSFYDSNPSVKGVKDSPFLHSGFRCMTIPMNEIDFTPNALSMGDKNIIRQSSTLITLVTLRELFRTASYDLGSALDQPVVVATRAEAGFVKMNYDTDSNTFVLSVIENRRRVPIIMTGKGTNWREIAIPAIKNLDAGSRSSLFNPERSAPDSFGASSAVSFSCYNISADFAPDGTIHCFVNQYTRKIGDRNNTTANSANRLSDGCFLVIPVDILRLQRKLLIEKDEEGNYKRSEIFKPLFRQFRFNFLHSYANNIRWTSSVKRDMNYMFNSVGGNVWYALTLVSGLQSEKQSVEPELELISALSQSTMFYASAGTYANRPFYTMPDAGRPFDPDPYEITRLLEAENGVGYERIRSGARFRARISYSTDNYEVIRPNYIIKVKAVCVQQREDGETKYVDACIRISSHEVKFVVDDENTPSILYTFQTDMRKLYDFYIYTKGTQVTFRVDELNSSSDTGENTVTKGLDFSRKTVAFYRSVMPVRTTSAEKKSAFTIITGGGKIADNYYEMYEAGWAFSNFDSDTRVYGGPQNGRSVSVRATGMKDLGFKAEDTHSEILYPVKISGNDRVSSSYHWPNGFRFNFSGASSKTNDSFTLKRQVLNDVNLVRSENLYGTWRSVDDSQDVYIWADAQDSNLDSFNVECFIVRGCNVPSVTLVGRNEETEDWGQIEVLDLTVYAFPVDTYHQIDGGQIASGAVNFADGKFSAYDYYFRADGQRAATVKRASGGSVSLRLRENVSYPEEGQVFSSKGYSILSSPVSYRYIGLKIEPFPTYHGYFTLENFDFGLLRSIPLEFNNDKGTGMKLEMTADVYTVHNEQDFYLSKRPSKAYEFNYALTDGKTLMKVVSAIDKIGMNRAPVWVVGGKNSSLENFSLCLVDSVSSIESLVEEDGDSYYKFSINLKSLDGE
jgi:hypothetical protein